MSSTSDDSGLPTISQQKTVISSSLNATLMFMFLMGLYSGIFAATVIIYRSRDNTMAGPRTAVALRVLTALYIVLLAEAAVQWYDASLVFSTQGSSRLSIFIASATTAAIPPAVDILVTVLEYAGFLLADGLMIWRCFHASGRSAMSCALPLLFFSVELALAIVDATLTCLLILKPGFRTAQNNRLANRIGGTLFAFVAATSLSATFVICYHIYVKTSLDRRSRRRYQHILDILVQSSSVYSVSVLVIAIFGFIFTGEVQSSLTLVAVSDFFESFAFVMAGLAPTLMVARLASASGNVVVEGSEIPGLELKTLENQPNNLSERIGIMDGSSNNVLRDDEIVESGVPSSSGTRL
ncbi:hypothetical protein CPC08DRAFT_821600 [Agrocybe pediades]|nr:hypothetical protein CPC08DRAFT_821600 [Agrocybe pediades]